MNNDTLKPQWVLSSRDDKDLNNSFTCGQIIYIIVRTSTYVCALASRSVGSRAGPSGREIETNAAVTNITHLSVSKGV